ncbi:MAG: hypothetical protein JNM27_04425 [Leptospirales bacterium]|nr:hypothetical protein [Leptospirales bacterium]
MLEVALSILSLSLINVSLGFAMARVLHCSEINLPSAHWLGFVALIILLEFWSLFLPVNIAFVWVILGSSLPGLFLVVRYLLKNSKPLYRLHHLIPLAAIPAILFTIYAGCKPVTWYDTPLYHLNAIRWINEFPAVPGLANLHVRLGFNSSFLLFGALSNLGPLTGKAAHVALPYLLCMSIAEIASRIGRRGLAGILPLLLLPYLLARAFSEESASLSTDLSTNCIMLVAILYLLDRTTVTNQVLAAGLCSLALVFKFTALPLAAIWVLILGLSTFRKKRTFIPNVLVLPALILSGFVLRNAILSGWLFFPAPVGNLHLSWSVPDSVAAETIQWIRGWAKWGPAFHPGATTDALAWVRPWLSQRRGEPEVLMILLTSFCVALSLALNRFRLRMHTNRIRLLAIGVLGALYNFALAPDFRFAGFFVWILLIGSFLLLLANLRVGSRGVQIAVLAFSVLWILRLHGMPGINSRVGLIQTRREGSAAVKSVRTEQGFEYHVPVEGDQCGNSEIPCAPGPVRLRMRKSGDIGAGFEPAGL